MTARTLPRYLVADIGGTNTRVALSQGMSLVPETLRRFKNAEYQGLEPILAEFVSDVSAGELDGACVAVAGPVRHGTAELTNRDWTIDTNTVARPAKTTNVAVLNDLEAQAHAVDHLEPSNLNWISEGERIAGATDELVIGLGTGFNCASVRDSDLGRHVTAAEAGHVNAPVRSASDLDLMQFIERTYDFPSVEEVLSGRGLEQVYRWHADLNGSDKHLSAGDIMAACQAGTDPLAKATVQTCCRLLGAVAGNLSLIHLPFGGVYLIGGVAQALAPYLAQFGFIEAFCDKGRFGDLVGSFPVAVVVDDYAALIGCAAAMLDRA